MTPEICPVPNCTRPVPGRFNTFCVVHHFGIPPEYTKLILRAKIACANTTNDEERQHLQQQLPGYIRTAMSKLPQTPAQGAA